MNELVAATALPANYGQMSAQVFNAARNEERQTNTTYSLLGRDRTETVPLEADLEVDYRPSDQRLTVEVEAAEADRVELWLTSETAPAGRSSSVSARQIDDETWRYTWLLDRDTIPAGRYEIEAVVRRGAEEAVVNAGVSLTYEDDDEAEIFDEVLPVDTVLQSARGETDVDEGVLDTVEAVTTVAAEETEMLTIERVVSTDLAIINFALTAPTVTRIELYATPQRSNESLYIGTARRDVAGGWRFAWDTTNTPAGQYKVHATAREGNRRFRSDPVSALVRTAPPVITTEADTEDEDTEVSDDDQPAEAIVPPTARGPIEVEPLSPETVAAREIVDRIVSEERPRIADQVEAEREIDTDPDVETTLTEIIADYEADINDDLQRLSSALRSGDEQQIEYTRERLRALERNIVRQSVTFATEEEALALEARVREVIDDRKAVVQQTEAIIRDRVGEAVLVDTDNDGITDFDERTLYNTDPEAADSDSDGFIDGVEILRGFNPNDAAPEAVIDYESPKEHGFTRPDILAVESIDTVTTTNQATGEPEIAAVISGRALPNSFVTLFIYSTPTIVTVRTEADGSWSYTFDKELENGEHEVYVGITDNAGRIVTKSEPLRFARTATAFTPLATAATEPLTTPSPEGEPLFSTSSVMFILSVSTIMIGLVLIIIGLFTKRQRPEHIVAAEYQPVT